MMKESGGHVANVANFSACLVFPIIFLAVFTHPACYFDPTVDWRDLDRENTLQGSHSFSI